MFSNIGWAEVGVILLVGIMVIGPERLPKLIKDARAMTLAARNGINNARQQIDGEFGDITQDIQDFAQPIQDLGSLRDMTPRKIITKTLFDDDDSYLSSMESLSNSVKDSFAEPLPGDATTGAQEQTPPAVSGAENSEEVSEDIQRVEIENSTAQKDQTLNEHVPSAEESTPKKSPQPPSSADDYEDIL